MPKQNITSDELVSWLHQELQWGDIHRKPFYEAIKAHLLSGRECARALQKYGSHNTPDHHCAYMVHSKHKCDCGLDKALATAIESGLMEKQG